MDISSMSGDEIFRAIMTREKISDLSSHELTLECLGCRKKVAQSIGWIKSNLSYTCDCGRELDLRLKHAEIEALEGSYRRHVDGVFDIFEGK